jgi:hypothetical protein
MILNASSIICGHRTITIADIADVSSHRMLGTLLLFNQNQGYMMLGSYSGHTYLWFPSNLQSS